MNKIEFTKDQLDLHLEALRALRKHVEKMASSPNRGLKIRAIDIEIIRVTAVLEGR